MDAKPDPLEDRKNRLEVLSCLVTKRLKNLEYLRRAHEGNIYWLNIIRISRDDIVKFQDPSALSMRAGQLLSLGCSIAPLLEIPSGFPFVRGVLQLLVEWEFHFKKGSKKSMKELQLPFGSAAAEVKDTWETFQPKVQQQGRFVYFERLRTQINIADIDYPEVICTICETLGKVYKKLLDPEAFENRIAVETVFKMDERFITLIIEPVVQEILSLAKTLIRSNLSLDVSWVSFDLPEPTEAVDDDREDHTDAEMAGPVAAPAAALERPKSMEVEAAAAISSAEPGQVPPAMPSRPPPGVPGM